MEFLISFPIPTWFSSIESANMEFPCLENYLSGSGRAHWGDPTPARVHASAALCWIPLPESFHAILLQLYWIPPPPFTRIAAWSGREGGGERGLSFFLYQDCHLEWQGGRREERGAAFLSVPGLPLGVAGRDEGRGGCACSPLSARTLTARARRKTPRLGVRRRQRL